MSLAGPAAYPRCHRRFLGTAASVRCATGGTPPGRGPGPLGQVGAEVHGIEVFGQNPKITLPSHPTGGVGRKGLIRRMQLRESWGSEPAKNTEGRPSRPRGTTAGIVGRDRNRTEAFQWGTILEPPAFGPPPKRQDGSSALADDSPTRKEREKCSASTTSAGVLPQIKCCPNSGQGDCKVPENP